MVAKNLNELVQQIEAYAAISRPALSSVLVYHRGEVILERYWNGFAAGTYQPVFSITKSAVSALVGLALADGKLTLADTLGHWFPDMPLTPHARHVTIHHLLTMTAGFERLKQKSDVTAVPLEFLLSRPMASPAGQRFHYDNADPDLIVNILERALDISVSTYAQERLFAPLGIWQGVPKSYRKRLWKTNKQGQARGGFGLHLTTRELALFGQLYLQCGAWAGTSLLPADYVAASTTVQASGGYPETVKYGYYFWIATTNTGHAAFFASGMGGQYVYVVPALDLVVVLTTKLKADGRPHRVMLTQMVTRFLETGDRSTQSAS